MDNGVDGQLLCLAVAEQGRVLAALAFSGLDSGVLRGEDDAELFQAWEDVIADMENASRREITISASPENELLKIAEMIECHIDIVGDRPKERKTVLLFNAAIREALTNAVRHAHANRLKVETKYRDNCFFVRISCNGRTDVTTIHERGGLSDLRRRLEQEGAELSMKIEDGVGCLFSFVSVPRSMREKLLLCLSIPWSHLLKMRQTRKSPV